MAPWLDLPGIKPNWKLYKTFSLMVPLRVTPCIFNTLIFKRHYISQSRNNVNFVRPPWSFVPKVNIKFFVRNIRIWQNSKDPFGSITGWKDTTTSVSLISPLEVLLSFSDCELFHSCDSTRNRDCSNEVESWRAQGKGANLHKEIFFLFEFYVINFYVLSQHF